MSEIHKTAEIRNSNLENVEVREYSTIHDSNLREGSRVYERVTVKKSDLAEEVDVNSGSYLENVNVGKRVQIGPNSTIAGVTHDLDDSGMEFRNDRFEEVKVEEGAFIGANSTVLPGVNIGKDAVVGAGTVITSDVDPCERVVGVPPEQDARKL